jgi:hypothetical protein
LKFQKGFWAVSGWMVAIILGLLLWGSTQKTPMEPGPKQTELRTPTEQATAVDLVDKNYPLVGEREPGWDYRQSVKADLDGDGAEETIVVMEREVMRVVPPLLEKGGFIPGCDHGVPPDISWRNFLEYTRLLARLTGWV